jgi:secretion/DNA translocation related TadE-like protein
VSADPDGEHGAGTVLLIGVVAVVLLCVVALAALGGAQQARSSAQAAADLGALAGASALRLGVDACATTEQTVVRHGAVLERCDVEAGGVVSVAVTRRAGPVSGLAGVAEAKARAGPASARSASVRPG